MMNGKHSTTKKATTTLVAAIVLASFAATQAVAAQPSREEFHSSGTPVDAARAAAIKKATTIQENPLGKPGAFAMMSNPDDPAVKWFERFDETVVLNSKTSEEVAILKRPLKQEVERVHEWSQTAQKVSSKYKYLALVLRNMQAPGGYPGLKEYANLTADWYADSAEIYDDLLKPRRAAKTMDELDDALSSIENRAKALQEMQRTLRAMDMDLRGKYHVHMRQADDALQQYVKGNPTEEEIKRVGGRVPAK